MLRFGVMLQHDKGPQFTPSKYGTPVLFRKDSNVLALRNTETWSFFFGDSSLKVTQFPLQMKWEGHWTISVRANGSLYTAFMHHGQSEAQWTLLLLQVATRWMALCTLSAAEARSNWMLRLQVAFLRVHLVWNSWKTARNGRTPLTMNCSAERMDMHDLSHGFV
jgi:hypothetical protein